jgi:hypothetical protein
LNGVALMRSEFTESEFHHLCSLEWVNSADIENAWSEFAAYQDKSCSFTDFGLNMDLNPYFDKQRERLANRTLFPVDELASYAGEWIAWSADGSRIIAHTTDPKGLDDLVRAAGEDPEECLIEGITAEDSLIGSAESGAFRR